MTLYTLASYLLAGVGPPSRSKDAVIPDAGTLRLHVVHAARTKGLASLTKLPETDAKALFAY
jgi:hypothetical protein